MSIGVLPVFPHSQHRPCLCRCTKAIYSGYLRN